MTALPDLDINLGVDLTNLDRGFTKAADAADDAVDEVESRFGDLDLTKVAAAAGVAAGVALVAGAVEGMQREASSDKLAAQLRLDPAEQAAAGRVAGSLYADAYGGSLDEVNTAVGGVISQLADLGDQDAVERLTEKALDYAAAFDKDVSQSISQAARLIDEGLAEDADEAFDLMVAGAQTVAPTLRDELEDAVEEYSGFFAQIGRDGADMYAALANADDRFELDKTGDAIKEFTIRATDMSTSSVAAFDLLGLSADTMAADILAGGTRASGAFDQIVQGLLSVQDPVAQSNAAIALFGDPLANLGTEKIPSFLEAASGLSGGLGDVTGRAAELGETLNSNAANRVEAMQNKVELLMARVVELPGPLGAAAAGVAGVGAAMQPVAPAMTGLAVLFKEQITSMASTAGTALASATRAGASWVASTVAQGATATVSMARTAATWVAQYARMAIASAANAARMAASWIVAMGPIPIVIAAVVGLVALIVANWDKVKEWTGRIWDWVTGKIKSAWDWITGVVSAAKDVVLGLVGALRDGVTSIVSGLVDTVLTSFRTFRDTAVSVVTTARDTIVGVFTNLKEGAVEKVGLMLEWAGKLPDAIVGAIGNLKDLLFGAGEDVVRGLWDGIKAMKDWIVSKLSNFVKDVIPGPIKSVLGINSPSKVTAALGQQVTAGLIAGVVDDERGVVAAAEAIARAAVPTMAGVGLPVGTPAGDVLAPRVGGLGRMALTIEMDGRQLARALDVPMGKEVRLRAGIRR